MNIVGIVVEYNPFHNGHLHHLNEIKKLYPNSLIIAVMSGNFNQRGEVSIIPKWDKAKLALHYGVDIVLELPYVFTVRGADIFAKMSIDMLHYMGIDTLVFGSESNDIEVIKQMASIQNNDLNYDTYVKKYIDLGYNYPTSMAKGLSEITNRKIDTPNDILGICYVKEIIRLGNTIKPVCIKRTNDYHSTNIDNSVSSATSIRLALKNGIDVINVVPEETYKLLKDKLYFTDEYFKFLKYRISTSHDLDNYHSVDEGIDYRIKAVIGSCNNLDELINKVKSKRYTYNRISRMLAHILTAFTKEEAKRFSEIEYIRVLGFSNEGKSYLNKIRKEIKIPIISNFSKLKNGMLDIEQRVTNVYASILNEEEKNIMVASEYKNKPIHKE